MGAYLSQPNTSKTSSDGGNSNISYGFSAMQGWRVSMEDAHNCIPEFDEETAMFSVYDGHGGEEVALYCSKYLPDIIKEQKTYKDGKLQKALEDAFLAIDSRITTEEVIKELVQIAGRPTEEPPVEKVAEEDDYSKSMFFDDSEESEEGEEEEGSDEEDGSEEEEGDSSEVDEEEDTEEGEEDSEEEEEEEMCLPGMDGKEEPGSDSGTTAVVALIRGKQLIVANAGDSRCVVSERGKAVDMSYDHKPEDEVELARIKNAGGKVTMDGRVNGGLNLSRAIGDHFYKRNKALPPEEQMISAMPDVKVLTLNEDHDFMVIACDGIWNVLSSQEVVDFITERIKPDQSGKVRALSSIVEELLDHCLAPNTSGDGTGCDNMTCIIVTLRPHPTTAQSDDTKKRKQQEEAEGSEPEENGNDSKKAKSD
uniref:protein-serine/threonine phosphatase n=1 Tax=Anabas testudineus TaxID=64144 RepID=A0A7N6BXS7_ANATE